MIFNTKKLSPASDIRVVFLSLLSGFFCLFAGSQTANAADVRCTAKVALNQTYTVDINEETGAAAIANLSGTKIDGVANRYLSGRTGDVTWFLAAGFDKGFEVSVENGGQHRIALCLAANECYLCR